MYKISIILGSYNRINFLKKTIDSIRQEVENIKHEIIVIDGGSNDGSAEWLLKQKDIITITQHNRGTFKKKIIERKSWGYFMNLGFRAASGNFILMLSDDCLLVPYSVKNALDELDQLEKSNRKIGAMAFFWRNWPEMKNYWVGTTFGKIFVNHGIYLKEALEKVDFINVSDYSFYHADGDLSLKIWHAGYEIIASSNSYVEHFTHANVNVRNSNLNKQAIDYDVYIKKWKNYNFTGIVYQEDWLYKDYYDRYETYRRFPKYEVYKYYVNKLKTKILK
jgi:glycosyltransferase involved in cell wall biosynthesis